jgi:hypothetical protein
VRQQHCAAAARLGVARARRVGVGHTCICLIQPDMSILGRAHWGAWEVHHNVLQSRAAVQGPVATGLRRQAARFLPLRCACAAGRVAESAALVISLNLSGLWGGRDVPAQTRAGG